MAFENGREVPSGVYKKGTMMWKGTSAYYKTTKDDRWTPMQNTAKWKIPKGYLLYVSGGIVRKKSI